ncbi:hypothetical protein NB636_05720 [Oxalobacter aliiformigenes]|uniref:acyltransferase family protein n=1 Tax=Oxalobacter aliiformigenes TaxID=2946593 RepID=UPI0022AED18B|nr:hypothetical protein [Oxalobacter aliiformigenes]MCZ4065204.1 hypothetical protein [Oxalobacter aliiformigenes]WAV98251.1 hypothetical protein NB636_05720 [Oxalobacter aliiformigenes]
MRYSAHSSFTPFPNVLDGFIGVDVFFAISGYLISGIIPGDPGREKSGFRQFHVRHTRRIFPALAVVLLSSPAFGRFALIADEPNRPGKHIAADAGFIPYSVLRNEAGILRRFGRPRITFAFAASGHRKTVLYHLAASAPGQLSYGRFTEPAGTSAISLPYRSRRPANHPSIPNICRTGLFPPPKILQTNTSGSIRVDRSF